MRKIVKAFLSKFRQSFVPQPPYYHKVISHNLKDCIKYFFGLVFFLNFLFFGGLFIQLAPKIPEFVTQLEKSLATYPAGLRITIQNGRLTTNDDRPFFLWMDYQGKKLLLAVVDDTATPEKISQYNSYMLFTSTSLVMSANKFRSWPRVMPYRSNRTIDVNKVEQWRWSMRAVIPFALFVIAWAFLLIPLMSSIMTLFYIYILSLAGYALFYWFVDKRPTQAGTLKIALHAVTFPLTLFYLLHFLRIHGNSAMVLPVIFVNLILIFILTGVYEGYIEGAARESQRRRAYTVG